MAALQNGNQANPSPLVLTLQGSVNPQREKINLSDQMSLLGKC